MKNTIYLINLDGSHERMDSASLQLKTVGLDFIRVSAVDGRKTNPEDLPIYDRKKAYAYLGRGLVGGEMGCYLSHIKCAELFLASDADIGIVIEDDIQLSIDFTKTIEDAVEWMDNNGHSGWEIINFGNQKSKLTTALHYFANAGNQYFLHKAHYFPMTTTGIVWSRTGAAEFIRASQVIYAPVDNYLRHWQTRRSKGYSFTPPLVSTTGSQSVIDSTAAGMRRKNNRAINYYYAKQRRLWIDKTIAMSRMMKTWMNQKTSKR